MFIPILPSALLEFLSAPTPYIMGVHESYKDTLAPDLVSDTRYNACCTSCPGHQYTCIFTEKTCNLSTLKEMIPSLERKKSLTNLSQVLIVVSVKNLHLVGRIFANNFCQIDQSQYYIIMKSQKLNFFPSLANNRIITCSCAYRFFKWISALCSVYSITVTFISMSVFCW